MHRIMAAHSAKLADTMETGSRSLIDAPGPSASSVPPWHGARPRRTGANRRAQKSRAHAKAIQLLLKGFAEIQDHRGGRLSRLGMALRSALSESKPHDGANCASTSSIVATPEAQDSMAPPTHVDSGGSDISRKEAHADDDKPNAVAPHGMPLVHRLGEGPLPGWAGPQDYWDNWQDHDNMDEEITPQLGAVSDGGGSLDLYCPASGFTQ